MAHILSIFGIFASKNFKKLHRVILKELDKIWQNYVFTWNSIYMYTSRCYIFYFFFHVFVFTNLFDRNLYGKATIITCLCRIKILRTAKTCSYVRSEFCFLFTAFTYQRLGNVRWVHFVPVCFPKLFTLFEGGPESGSKWHFRPLK